MGKKEEEPKVLAQPALAPKKFKLVITLSTGEKHHLRVKEDPNVLDQILGLVVNNWMSQTDGYIRLNNNSFKISSIIHYSCKRRWL
jgi:hypothetical protein